MTFPAPRPTSYKNTTYKSKLEAQWAVLFDHHPQIMDWRYEPCVIKSRETGWRYTPDFWVKVMKGTLRIRGCPPEQAARLRDAFAKCDVEFYLEIKPAKTSMDYDAFIDHMSYHTPAQAGRAIPLYLCYGHFHNLIFHTRRCGHNGGPDADYLNVLLFSDRAAVHATQNFRFDLD